jgi:hypothetical protein
MGRKRTVKMGAGKDLNWGGEDRQNVRIGFIIPVSYGT